MSDTVISIYISEDEKQTLQREAENEHESLSAYCKQLIRRQRRDEATADMVEQLDPEEYFNQLAGDIRDAFTESIDEFEATAEDMQDLQRQAARYSIATFDLVGSEYSDARRRDVLDSAKRRTYVPIDEHDVEVTDGSDSDTDGTDDSSDDENDLHDRLS